MRIADQRSRTGIRKVLLHIKGKLCALTNWRSQPFQLDPSLQKHLVKGQDLQNACVDIANLKEPAHKVRDQLSAFGERLERTRERIEGAARLHHLLGLRLKADDGIQQEMERLAHRIGVPGLVEMCRRDSAMDMGGDSPGASGDGGSPVSECSSSVPANAKHDDGKATTTDSCKCWREATSQPIEDGGTTQMQIKEVVAVPFAENVAESASLATSTPTMTSNFQSNRDQSDDYESDDEDEEEDHSKMADSGLGYCERCEGNGKMTRACSCQSFDDPTNTSSKR